MFSFAAVIESGRGHSRSRSRKLCFVLHERSLGSRALEHAALS